jgi:hypothetical protein
MATASEVALLREYTNEPLNSRARTDAELNAIIDEAGGVYAAARRMWTTYAQSLSTLVDVTESGSSRKMGDLYKNALAIAGTFGDGSDVGGGGRRPRSTAIVRGDAP